MSGQVGQSSARRAGQRLALVDRSYAYPPDLAATRPMQPARIHAAWPTPPPAATRAQRNGPRRGLQRRRAGDRRHAAGAGAARAARADEPRPLRHALAEEWHAYLAFLTSFATVGIMWVNHHRLFTLIGRVDHWLLMLNLLLLLMICGSAVSDRRRLRIPRRRGAQTATLVLGGIFVLTAIVFNAIWAIRGEQPTSDRDARPAGRGRCPDPAVSLRSSRLPGGIPAGVRQPDAQRRGESGDCRVLCVAAGRRHLH